MTLLAAITALLIHESGHIWCALALGQPAKGLVFRWWGIGVRIERSPSPWVNAVIAAGGPLASLAAMLICCYLKAWDGAWWNCGVLLFGSVLDFWNMGRAFYHVYRHV